MVDRAATVVMAALAVMALTVALVAVGTAEAEALLAPLVLMAAQPAMAERVARVA